MTWAQRLKRVFNIDIETCSGCGGAMKVIACIEDPIGVVCGRGRNPTLRLWPAIFSGEIDVFPSERRNMGQEIGR